jgi:uncharacterized delta-60 repeat protein
MRKLSTALVTAILVLATAAPSGAATTSGSRDKSFSGDGKVTFGFGGYRTSAGRDVLVKSSGKVVMVAAVKSGGNAVFGISRLKKNGRFDASFSGNGRRTTGFSGAAAPRSVVALGSGRVLVGGSAGGAFGLAAYRSDGSPATSFGGDGKVTTEVSLGADQVLDLRVLSNGKILAAGIAGDQFAVVRYRANGRPDDTFGTDGVVLTSAGFEGTAYDVGLQPDGKLLAVGNSEPGGGSVVGVATARFDRDGSLDETFGGGDGRVEAFPGDAEFSRGYDVLVQPDGKVVVGGYSFGEGDYSHFLLLRYHRNGTPDGSFGRDGVVEHLVQPYYAEVHAITRQSDGKLVAAGWTGGETPGLRVLAVARYGRSGKLDKSFSRNGQTYVSYGANKRAQAFGVAVRGDRVVAVGEVANANNTRSKATVVAFHK